MRISDWSSDVCSSDLKNRGWSLRYKKTRAFVTLVPEYRRFSAVVVMGGAEREKFEERRYVWRPQLVKLYDEAKTRSEEHTSELESLMRISYAVFCLKK